MIKKINLRTIIYTCEYLLSIAGLIFLIINIFGDKSPQIYGAAITAILAGIMPSGFEKLFKFKFPTVLHIIYTLYVIGSSLIGSIFDVFNNVWWYDKAMHSLIGYIMCILAIYVFKACGSWEKENVVGSCLQIFSFSMMWSAIWETLEFFADNMLSQVMQHGLIDTMYDIIFHLIFTLAFVIQFIISRKTKFGLGINFILKSLDS